MAATGDEYATRARNGDGMNAGGLAVAIVGVLVITQVTLGHALERLGITTAIVKAGTS